MKENKKEQKSAISTIKKISLVIIALYVLYVIAGFWIVPPLIKPMVEKELSSQLGRSVTIEQIKISIRLAPKRSARRPDMKTVNKPDKGKRPHTQPT